MVPRIYVALQTTQLLYEEFKALVKMLFFNPKLLIYFFFLDQNVCCGYSIELPQPGASNEYPQCMFSWGKKKNIYLIPTLI